MQQFIEIAVGGRPTTGIKGHNRKSRQKHRIGWVKFEEHFLERFPNYLHELARSHPNLSKTEVEVCAMLRDGLSSWEIADILGITERSIENHRCNIRHKFGLETSQNLHTFLLAIDSD